MRKILSGIFIMALAATLTIAARPQDRGDRQDRDDRRDNGKHKGQDKHEDRGDEGDRHDNGKHKGWDNERNPNANWDSEHERILPARGYPYVHYEHVQ